MRLLYVVQRYGETIAGGAEQYCREMAERMTQRGHHVEVATTCARSYVDWADAYEPGRSMVEGVPVHRFRVAAPRDNNRFSGINRRMVQGRGARPLFVQREWMREQGPWSPDLVTWLERNANRFDCVVCFTYLYWTTWAALDALARSRRSARPPLDHSRRAAAAALAVRRRVPRAPTRSRSRRPRRSTSSGAGSTSRRPATCAASGSRSRPTEPIPRASARRTASGDKPYLLYVGRIDEGKGALALVDYFIAYKDRHPDDDLVLARRRRRSRSRSPSATTSSVRASSTTRCATTRSRARSRSRSRRSSRASR